MLGITDFEVFITTSLNLHDDISEAKTFGRQPQFVRHLLFSSTPECHWANLIKFNVAKVRKEKNYFSPALDLSPIKFQVCLDPRHVKTLANWLVVRDYVLPAKSIPVPASPGHHHVDCQSAVILTLWRQETNSKWSLKLWFVVLYVMTWWNTD